MSDIAIKVENLSKRYRIGLEDEMPDTLVGAVTQAVKRPLRNWRRLRRLTNFRDNGRPSQPEDSASSERSNVQTCQPSNASGVRGDVESDTIWALKEVSFEVERGEVVGIIGRNGAGKSTLLKILSQITAPTEGRAVINGRVGSLLEVGTGFHPELTGRENIYLNGAILGMTKGEIDGKFDEIVDFSGVEKFIDTPVKRYSSGMRVRLAFAVAAHLNPEILLIDEVLAVGDVAFQKKCLGKMSDVAGQGRTVLFVSHNMGAIRSLCQRAVLLQEGKLVSNGVVNETVDRYLSQIGYGKAIRGEVTWAPDEAPGSDCIRCDSLRVLNGQEEIHSVFGASEEITVEFEYTVEKSLQGFRFHLTFVTERGEVAFRTTDHNQREGELLPGKYLARCVIPANLFNERRYSVMIGGGIPNVRSHVKPAPVLSFEVQESSHGSYFPENWPGVLAPDTRWQTDISLDH
jgi:lipopolysaccharide transport system ATP-binding protein